MHSLSFTKQLFLLVGIIILVATSFISGKSDIVVTNQFGSFDLSRGLIDLFDYDKKTLHSITMDGKKYQVIQYTNYIPYVNGIEVVKSDGTVITDTNIVRKVFDHVGWIEAAKKYSTTDLNTLKDVLNFANRIHDYISPINSDISYVLTYVDILKNQCINVIIFKGCAWDLVEYQIPGISAVESVVRGFNNELTSWRQSTYEIQNKLPSTINVIEQLKSNQKVPSNLKNNIRSGISALSGLETKSDQLSDSLYDIASILSKIKNPLYDASDLPLIGGVIYKAASFFGDLENEVYNLRNGVNEVSNILSLQSSKLNKLINDAERKSDELHNSWWNRQNALPIWNMIVISIMVAIIVIAVIVPIIVVKRNQIMKNRKTMNYTGST